MWPSSDAARARVRRIALSTVSFSRRAAPPTLEWIKTHKAIVTILVLVIYIAFGPRKITTVEVIKEAPSGTVSGQTSGTGRRQERAQEAIAGVPLYNNGGADKDVSWGLPAELDTEQNKAFAIRLKKLEQRFAVFSEKEQLVTREYEAFANSPIEALLFERIAGSGFRDRDLPLEWRKVSKYNGLNGLGEQVEDGATQATTQGMFSGRILLAKSDVIRGEPTVGDTLFASAFEKYLDGASKNVEQEMSVIAAFSARAVNEFPELPLTYYDADETVHVHEAVAVTVNPLSQEEVGVMQKLYAQCKADADRLDELISQGASRRELIKETREAVLRLNDAKIKSEWSDVTQARDLANPANVGYKYGFGSLPDKLVGGQVNAQDKIFLQSYSEKIQTDMKEAIRQKALQLAFKADVAKYPAVDTIGGDQALWSTTDNTSLQK
jgi:hypothetical protein